jgi:DhnA family fructose-bisphosphate aldolase class Ia
MSRTVGKTMRLKRLIRGESRSCIIFAIDHGMTALKVPQGIIESRLRVREAIAGGANVVMLGRGLASQVVEELPRDASMALLLTASAAARPQGPMVTAIGSVEEALRIGADAVVVFVALAGDNEAEMISFLSDVGEKCELLGMPLIAEAEFPDIYQSLTEAGQGHGVEYLKRNARLCAELGADIVKANWSGSQQSFSEVVAAAGVPVVLAGGPLVPVHDLLKRMENGRDAGAIGCSVGRNIFESERPQAVTRAISAIFQDGKSAKEALEEYEGD